LLTTGCRPDRSRSIRPAICSGPTHCCPECASPLTDSAGRRFGNAAWAGKRNTPQQIPDPRIVHLDTLFDLSTKSVLEVGCFEGVHTIALAQRAAQVHAIDSRVENVVKTLVRTNLFGHHPVVWLCDLKKAEHLARLPKVDVMHHVGVLYHLKDPVQQLHCNSKAW
jgi:2-polyprenyl-3-methyl-5-hydroxy-6-metoxy-1,4-benzoquinol methylase